MLKKWTLYLKNEAVKKIFIIFIILLLGIAFITPYFFNYIQHRNGVQITDRLLDLLPTYDLSILIFIIIWFEILFVLVNGFMNPRILIRFITAYTLTTLSRFLCIIITNLDPPIGIVELKDPFLSTFFTHSSSIIIDKDLFFSGHTSTGILIYLCLINKNQKKILFILNLILMFSLLIQHIHYTIDIVGGIMVAYLIYFTINRFYLNKILKDLP